MEKGHGGIIHVSCKPNKGYHNGVDILGHFNWNANRMCNVSMKWRHIASQLHFLLNLNQNLGKLSHYIVLSDLSYIYVQENSHITNYRSCCICKAFPLWHDQGGWFKIKMSCYQYWKSHCGDKTILRPSYLHNGISNTGKMSTLYWIRDQQTNGPASISNRRTIMVTRQPFPHCGKSGIFELTKGCFDMRSVCPT